MERDTLFYSNMSDTMSHSGGVREVDVAFYDRPFNAHPQQSYAIPIFTFSDDAGKIVPVPTSAPYGSPQPSHLVIQFVRGHKDKDERKDGILTEHLLEMLIHRQAELNLEFHSEEGVLALQHLRSALHALTYRKVDRTIRGVLNRGKN